MPDSAAMRLRLPGYLTSTLKGATVGTTTYVTLDGAAGVPHSSGLPWMRAKRAGLRDLLSPSGQPKDPGRTPHSGCGEPVRPAALARCECGA
jgi:hypothetical protein